MFGGTLWSLNTPNHEQDLSIAIPYRPKQVHSTFRGASTSPWFFGWTICSSLSSSSFGGWTACSADSLVQNPLFRHWHRKPSRFHCHRVPDSFQLPHCDGFVEVRPRDPLDLVRAPLVFVRYRACFLGGEVLGDFPGLCKILHETTLLVWNHMGFPSCIPVSSLG